MDANQQPLAYVYSRETKADASTAKGQTEDEARRIASNIQASRRSRNWIFQRGGG